MNRNRWMWTGGLAGLLIVVALGFAGIGRSVGAEGSPKPPPLTVDKSAPLLLLDEPKPQPKARGKKGANNESCLVCHGNFREEPIAQIHAKANVGCAKCHGTSAAHEADEDNVTPPEKIYGLVKIDAMCKECHEEHNASARKVVERWQKKCPAKTDPAAIVCTDCHGAHRLAVRTVQWDKTTKKLIKQKEPGKK